MPKVDLGSTTNLLASPFQVQKGHARDVKPFAKVLSSLDAGGKSGHASAEPVGEPVETITTDNPPASPAEDAGCDEARAVDADREQVPAQDEPMQAQDCVPHDDAQSSESAAEEPELSVERELFDAKGESGLDRTEVAVIGGGSTAQLSLAPLKSVEVTSVREQGNAGPQATEQGVQPAQKAMTDAPELGESAGEFMVAQQASSNSTRGDVGQSQAALSGARASSSLVSTKAVNGREPSETGVIAEPGSSGIAKDAAPVVVDSKLAPAPLQAIEATTDPIDRANVENESEPLRRRPMSRTKAASPPVIRPVLTSSDTASTRELNPTPSQVGVQPGMDQVMSDYQMLMDEHRQDANQELPPSQPHQATTLHHPTSTTTVQAGQVAATSTQPAPTTGNSQKSGASNAIGPVAVPLSGTQVKQMALDRLTAQAPLLKQGIEQASFIPQAAKGLAMALKQSDGTITLKLTPGHLGALKIEVTLQGTEVAARLEPSTESARQLLIDSQSSLRAALEARGLSVERIEVTAPQSAPAQDARDQRNPGQHQDHPGAGFAGQGDAGRHTGRDAESSQGQQGKAIGHRFETATGTDEPRPMTQDPTITLALDNGGTYRLHLDAVA